MHYEARYKPIMDTLSVIAVFSVASASNDNRSGLTVSATDRTRCTHGAAETGTAAVATHWPVESAE